jgi:hypothetical protein
LSPANGQMVTVRVWGRIVDLGSGLTATSLQYAVKDEYQLVQPTGQFAVDATGNYQFTLLLPASRNGGDLDGRHYIIRVNARDNAGNLGANWGSVVVP